MLMSQRHMAEHDSTRLHELAWLTHPDMQEGRKSPSPRPSDRPTQLARRASERSGDSLEPESSAPKRRRPHSAAVAEGGSSASTTFRRPTSPRPSSAYASRLPPSSTVARQYQLGRGLPPHPASGPAPPPIRLPPFSALASGVPPFQTPRRVSSESEGGGSSAGRFAYGPRRSSSPASHSSGGGRRPSSQAVTGAEASAPSRNAANFRYELVIRQQPGRAAAAGFSPSALSRLPIVPSPILRLRVIDETGAEVSHSQIAERLPYLVCSCSLSLAAGGEHTAGEAIDFVIPANDPTSGSTSTAPLAMLCGTRAYSAVEARDLDGEPGIFFVFWDVSVRQVGSYRMTFTLVEALPGSPTLATVRSEPFNVVQLAQFPGNVTIATDLSRHFQAQGQSVYLPPLSAQLNP